jgi:hypothetical protein
LDVSSCNLVATRSFPEAVERPKAIKARTLGQNSMLS